MLRKPTGLALAIAMAASAVSVPAPVRASDAGDVIAGIAIGAGVVALGAAAASSAQRYYKDPYYDYNQGLSPEGNAVAACSHKTWRTLSRDGANKVIIRKVKDTRPLGKGEWRVKLRVEARYSRRDRDVFDVVCRVLHDRVVKFRYA
ncbi:hypothetical protein [Rhodoligotrophos ferricapiens]|uniref:hypothetical protein n=1 Tax=Rhodoligotrophos ferricapiens TaxID=3069264 RepID=UPI00315CB330